MYRKTQILLFSFSLSFLSFGQAPNIKFNHITTKEGLVSNRVHSIGQDKDGFIWFGTPLGLQRFDGYKLKTYHTKGHYGRSPIFEDNYGSLWMVCEGGREVIRLDLASETFKDYPSLGNRTTNLVQDRVGRIWAATLGNGLAEYIRKDDDFKTYKFNPNDDNSIISDSITVIFQGIDYNLWLGTVNGLCRYDPDNRKFYGYNEGPKGRIYSIDQDKNGIFWLGTKDGLYEFHASSEDFINYKLDNLSRIDNIFIDSKDRLWLTTNFGILYFDRTNSEYVHHKNFFKYIGTDHAWTLNPIIERQNGSIWSVSNLRLSRYNPIIKDFSFFINDPLNKYSVNDEIFCEIFEDNSNNLWLGTKSGGVNFVSAFDNQFIFFPKKLVTTLYVDRRGILWIGSQNGLYKTIITNGKREYKKIKGIDDLVCQISEDNSGDLWIAGFSHLIKLYHNSEKIEKYSASDRIQRVLVDQNDYIWVAAGNGVYKFDKYEKIFSHIIEFSGGVFSLNQDRSSNIWISNDIEDRLTIIRNDSLIPFYFNNVPIVESIFEDSDNQIWGVCGIPENILLKIDQNQGVIKDFRPSKNLISGNFQHILFEKDNLLWLLTTKGITKYDLKTGRAKNFSLNDGNFTPSTSFPNIPYCKGNNNEIFIAGNEGYIMFYPDSVKENPNPPPIVLTDFKLKNKSIDVKDSSYLNKNINDIELIELPFSENIFSIEFAALDYNAPYDNQYAYKLEGFNDNWVFTDAGSRSANYTNLDPGNYVFRVKGTNCDGIWNETGVSLKIIILSPWYSTWWAYSLYTIFLLLFSSYFYIQMQRRLRLKHEIEMKNFEVKKIKEIDEMKSKFFANITHEFRTPLTLIKGPIEQLLEGKKVDDPNKIYRMIKRNSERLLNLINELLDLSKLESGKMKLSVQKSDIVSFVKGIAMSFESLAATKDIQIHLHSDHEIINIYFDKEKMQKIVANLLSNAFKFTDKDGKINIHIKDDNEEQRVKISVSDNGIGIPEKELTKIFDRFYQVQDSKTNGNPGTGIGLALTKELVEMQRGKIIVKSRKGVGTTFYLSFPKGRDHFSDDEIIYEERLTLEPTAENYEGINPLSSKAHRSTLLIVEDNNDVREYIVGILKDKYNIVIAVDGSDGLTKASEIMPDLIISDIMMPRMSGDEMAVKIKNDIITSHIPIILLTAKAADEDRINGLETGADDYLVKPFNEKELLVRVNNLIVQRNKLREKYLREAELNPVEVAVTSLDKKFIENLLSYIEENISDQEFGVDHLTNKFAMSRSQLYRKFSSVLGEKPNEFIRKFRIKRAAELFKKGFGNVTEVAYEVGFNDLSYFSKCFKNIYHVAPHKFTHQK